MSDSDALSLGTSDSSSLSSGSSSPSGANSRSPRADAGARRSPAVNSSRKGSDATDAVKRKRSASPDRGRGRATRARSPELVRRNSPPRGSTRDTRQAPSSHATDRHRADATHRSADTTRRVDTTTQRVDTTTQRAGTTTTQRRASDDTIPPPPRRRSPVHSTVHTVRGNNSAHVRNSADPLPEGSSPQQLPPAPEPKRSNSSRNERRAHVDVPVSTQAVYTRSERGVKRDEAAHRTHSPRGAERRNARIVGDRSRDRSRDIPGDIRGDIRVREEDPRGAGNAPRTHSLTHSMTRDNAGGGSAQNGGDNRVRLHHDNSNSSAHVRGASASDDRDRRGRAREDGSGGVGGAGGVGGSGLRHASPTTANRDPQQLRALPPSTLKPLKPLNPDYNAEAAAAAEAAARGGMRTGTYTGAHMGWESRDSADRRSRDAGQGPSHGQGHGQKGQMRAGALESEDALPAPPPRNGNGGNGSGGNGTGGNGNVAEQQQQQQQRGGNGGHGNGYVAEHQQQQQQQRGGDHEMMRNDRRGGDMRRGQDGRHESGGDERARPHANALDSLDRDGAHTQKSHRTREISPAQLTQPMHSSQPARKSRDAIARVNHSRIPQKGTARGHSRSVERTTAARDVRGGRDWDERGHDRDERGGCDRDERAPQEERSIARPDERLTKSNHDGRSKHDRSAPEGHEDREAGRSARGTGHEDREAGRSGRVTGGPASQTTTLPSAPEGGARGQPAVRRGTRWAEELPPPPPQPVAVPHPAEALLPALPAGGADKAKVDFGLSGVLADESNMKNGVVQRYTVPEDQAHPDKRWRLYVFKGDAQIGEPLQIHRQSTYLFGKDRKIADIPAEHQSCSKQHAVLQFRETVKRNGGRAIRPYLMDLNSTNGTSIGNATKATGREWLKLEPQHFYELLEKDTFKLGASSREYVILTEDATAEDGE